MAKSKYTEETVEKILEAIACDGCDESGWLAGSISHETFYTWQSKYPDFSESVVRAKEEFRKYCPEAQVKKARDKLNDALENGHRIRWRSQSTKRIDHYNSDGSLKWYQIHTEEASKEEDRPTPQWAIERVIPRPINTLDQLIAAASEYGCTVVVKDADLFNRYLQEVSSESNKGNSRAGLTEEEAASIRAKILGLAE
jgi:hypothetical protein